MPIKRVDGRAMSPEVRRKSWLQSGGLIAMGLTLIELSDHHGSIIRGIALALGTLLILASVGNAIWLLRTRSAQPARQDAGDSSAPVDKSLH